MTQVREHRIASYNRGCKCSDCKGAKRDQGRRLRSAEHRKRDRRDGDVMCVSCCCWFHPKGIGPHEVTCGP